MSNTHKEFSGTVSKSAEGWPIIVTEVSGCSWTAKVVVVRAGKEKAYAALGHTALAAKRAALREARAAGAQS